MTMCPPRRHLVILLGPVCADDPGERQCTETNEQDAPDERIEKGQRPSEGVGSDVVGDDQYREECSDTAVDGQQPHYEVVFVFHF